MERTLDHVAIAVPSLAVALPLFELLAGTAGSPVEHVPEQGVRVTFVGSGPCRLELIEPTGAESPVARFLARRGSGLHHIAFRVPDLPAALADLAGRGWQLIDEAPRPGAHGREVAFVHPRSAMGVLIELLQD